MKSSFKISLSNIKAHLKEEIVKDLEEHKIKPDQWLYFSTDKDAPDVQSVLGFTSDKYKGVTFCLDTVQDRSFKRVFFRDSHRISEDITGVVFPNLRIINSAIKKKDQLAKKALILKKQRELEMFSKRAKEARQQLISLKKTKEND